MIQDLLRWLEGQGMVATAELVRQCNDGDAVLCSLATDYLPYGAESIGDALIYAWAARQRGDDLTPMLGPAQALVRLLFEAP